MTSVDKPVENNFQGVDNRLSSVAASRNPLRSSRNRDGYPHTRLDRQCDEDIAYDIERERYGRPVREHKPSFSRDYLDLLALADADIRAYDEKKRESA